MKYARRRVFLMALALATCAAVHAGSGNTLQDELRIFSEETATQCNSVKAQLEEFKASSDPLTG